MGGSRVDAILGQAWIEVDLDAIAENVRLVRRLIGPVRRFMAVVKADGYGHGAPPTASIALENGATDLGVTRIAEALELRAHGIDAPVLVFNQPTEDQVDLVVKHDLTVTLWDLQVAAALAAAARRVGRRVRAHLKVDTGMGRFGLLDRDVIPFVRQAADLPGIEWEGIYTHFANAFRGGRHNRGQLTRFLQLNAALADEGYDFPVKHAANSAAILDFPESHLDMVRAGNIIYGVDPRGSRGVAGMPQNAWRFKARVVRVQALPAGSPVGYGSEYVARRPVVIATLPVGYVDGLAMEPVTRSHRFVNVLKVWIKTLLARMQLGRLLGVKPADALVLLRGRPARIIGRVCMQQCMVEAGGLPGFAAGEEVEIRARRTGVNPRLPRLYLRQGLPVQVRAADGGYHPAEAVRFTSARREVAAGDS